MSFLVLSSDSPYLSDRVTGGSQLYGGVQAPSPLPQFSMQVIMGDAPGNEVKTLGNRAVQPSLGKLAPINPLYAGTNLANWGNGAALHDDVRYRNRARQIDNDLRMHDDNFRFDDRHRPRTVKPMADVIPVDYFLPQ